MEAALHVIRAWTNFYIITGSSAAALTGLMFVVITLVASRPREANVTTEGMRVFSTPTVVHFCTAFLISGMLAAPWRSVAFFSAAIGLVGLGGVVYIAGVIRGTMRLTTYHADVDDWIWFVVLPLVAYALVAATALLVPWSPETALFLLAAATMLLIFIGIRNSWDVVTYLAIDFNQRQ